MPALIIVAVLNLLRVSLRRLVGMKMHPKYSLLHEVGVEVLKDAFRYVDRTELTRFQALVAHVKPKAYPLKQVKTSKFVANWYGHKDPGAKVYYYMHGGGYIFGHSLGFMDAFNHLLKAMEKRGLKVAIFTLEYTLAPEHPFPSQIYQAAAGYEYLLKNLSISPEDIIVGGDSAGGGLALAMCYHVRETLPMPAGLVLISPWVDSRNCARHASNPNVRTDYLTVSAMVDASTKYLNNQPQNHLSSPIMGDTKGLPRMILNYGGLEIFKDDIILFAEKVKKENGEDKVFMEVDPDMPHDYTNIPEVFSVNAVKSIGKIADFMVNTYMKYDFSKSAGTKK